MLDQLVESRSTASENTRRGEFMLITLILIVVGLIGAWTYSLYGKQFEGWMGGDLGLNDLLPPVSLPEEAPPPPEPVKQEKTVTTTNKVVLKDLFASMANTQTPPKDLTGAAKTVAVPKGLDLNNVTIGNENRIPANFDARGGDGNSDFTPGASSGSDDGDAPPPPKPTPKPPSKPISGGVLNGKATNLVRPPYPAAARAVRASGQVSVAVTIDENGSVISASATSGHPLLRAAAAQAARSSRFSPTLLSGQPVKVTGTIVYNFVAP